MHIKCLHISLGILLALSLSSCHQETQPCMESTERSNNGHLVDLGILQTDAPEFIDSLNAYPQLQAASIRKEGNNLRMDCNVYHENVRLFFASYNLLKNLETGSIHPVGTNQVAYSLNIEPEPSITGEEAVEAARRAMDFGGSCLTYTLGVIEQETGNYYLIWFVAAEENTDRFVMLDAHTNEVLRINTGIWE